MPTFQMLKDQEARTVAESTTQVFNALICCLSRQGINPLQLISDLEEYRATHQETGGLNPVAEETMTRIFVSLGAALR
ncbi:hypothetical protein J2X56_001614 [Herbaspirillum sp. 1173]|uniref:hypothetical protein n=1 Tax=Herbaspirillum sp. 1173 TaxID=2817734 RepID=UPI00285EA3BB|nr:hypothetical protein [Herbaspirillum sp. 1173]MDR6739600.1 hypothetical protein [Herbaspirillum sp. 1173]